MKSILLPPVINEKKFGKKNILRQMLADETVAKISSAEVRENHLILTTDSGQHICIIHDADPQILNFARVLRSNIKPTANLLKSKELTLNWVKFPGLGTFQPECVLSSWDNSFKYKEEDLEKEVYGLRKPQIGAIYNILSHFRVGDGIGTVIMPTGTGKTETMLSVLIANQCKKLLVTVPTDPLREQISTKFLSLGYLQNDKFQIVAASAQKPIVGILYENFQTTDELKSFLDNSNVVVATMDLITSGSMDLQRELARSVSHLFIDEAHHVKAPTWTGFRNLLDAHKVIQFTATPFRNDGQSIDGAFIFNYSLKKAQNDGYFKKIELLQVNEWDNTKADYVLASAGVNRLREDLKQFDHILMARCNSRSKADAVFKIYEQYADLNPVIIHTGLSQKIRTEAKEKILSKKAKIIVCVDMLGEGFDLPNLKIAVFHEIRKSLPITIQLAGRFTRTKIDESLGNVSIVVNLKDANVSKELEEFYALGADWNSLLPKVSTHRINKELDFNEFLNGFEHIDESKIPFQSLKPALSTVVYRNKSNSWFPRNFLTGIPDADHLDFIYHDINHKRNTLVVITGKKIGIDWGNSKDIYNIEWNLYIAYWETKNNLLFINASDNINQYRDLATAIIGDDAEIINKINTFKAFYGINRVRLQNVGLKEFLGRNISFTMRTGYDIEAALELAAKQKAEKAFVFGTGFENGEKISLGCSYKGRIWSHAKGDLQKLVDWCDELGSKLVRDDIDPNTILKETLMRNSVSMRPIVMPFAIDWNEFTFLEPETRITFVINNIEHGLYNTELQLVSATDNGDLIFELVTPDERIKIKQELFNNGNFDDYVFKRYAGENEIFLVRIGRRQLTFEQYFYEYPPTWWFIDGSSLSGNDYVELKQLVQKYPQEKIVGRNWEGVDISKESQAVDPKITDSIQHKLIQELKAGDFDIIFDDDYSGEIADIITVKLNESSIAIQLYHLKYAKDGKVGQRIDNLYEVCGQAVKSVIWKFKESKELFEHMLRREIKKRKGKSCSRIEHGDKEKLILIKEMATKKFPIEFEVFLVQPGLSSLNPSLEQLTLLGMTDSYLLEKGNMMLTVIGTNV
jgi:superfamily II DNA or RNA helicase